MDNAVSDFVYRISELGNPIPFIPYADRPMTTQVVQAVLNGAIDYIGLEEEPFRISAVLTALNGTSNLRMDTHANISGAQDQLRALTKRQMQILECVSKGMSNREIGEKYRISHRTVEIHRSAMMSRLGVKSSIEAIKIAFIAGVRI